MMKSQLDNMSSRTISHQESQNGGCSEQEQQASQNTPRKGFIFTMAFIALSVVAFTSALDATILSISLPIISQDLALTSFQSFWAGIAFLLSSNLLQPIHTSFSDIFGRKPALYVCMIFFLSGTTVVGCSRNAMMLILGRTIQGMGGGGMEALSEVILTDLTTLKDRPFYVGLLGLFWALGSILGPIVGGAFSQYVSWRWIAWINIPLLGTAFVLIPLFLKLTVDPLPLKSKIAMIDIVGIVLFIPGLTLFILAIVWGGELFPWSSWETIVPLTIGSFLLILFTIHEWRVPYPMIPIRLVKDRTVAATLLGAFVHGILLWCVVYYLPLYFEAVIQHSPLRAAVDGFPLAFTVTPMSILCAVLIDQTKRYMWTLWLAWFLCTVGLGTMILLGYNTSVALSSCLQIAPGIGMGFLFPALGIPLQAAVSADKAGLAMGTFVFARALGSTVGVAIGSTIFSNEFARQLQSLTLPSTLSLQNGNDAIQFIDTLKNLVLPMELKTQLMTAYAESFKWIWVVLTCFSFVGLLSTWFIEELTLESVDVGRQAFVAE